MAPRLLASTGWQALSQLAPLVINLLLTPFVIISLGKVAYGLWFVCSSLTQLVGQFDGGVGRTAQRFLTIYAGNKDRVASTKLVVTTSACLGFLVILVVGPLFLGVPAVATFFHAPDSERADMELLLRVMCGLIAVGLVRNVFSGVLFAHHNFRLFSTTQVTGHVLYASTMVATLSSGWGLRGVAAALVVQQAWVTLLLVPAACRHLAWRGVRWMPKNELLAFARISWKMQFSGLINLFGLQGVMLVVGRLVPDQMPDFAPGSTFAQQLRMLPMNAVTPIQSTLGNAFGAYGANATLPRFGQLQQLWVMAICGWGAVGLPACFVGVNLWLPLEGELVGAVATLLFLGHLCFLLPQITLSWALLLGRPDLELRSGLVSMALTIAGSVAAAPTYGILGVCLVAITAQGVGMWICLVGARRLPVPPPGPISDIPWLAVAAGFGASSLSSGLVWCLNGQGRFPAGALGLMLTGLASLPAAIVYLMGCGEYSRAKEAIMRRMSRG